jgi:Leu/Phe-tRNA-protein transferase
LALVVVNTRVQKQKSVAVVVVVTNPSIIQHSSNILNQSTNQKAKSMGSAKSNYNNYERMVNNMDNKHNVSSINKRKIWKISLDNILEY